MSNELEAKYRPILTEFAKSVGAAANTNNLEEYKFLLNNILIILQTGFDLLKRVDGTFTALPFEDLMKVLSKEGDD